MKPLFQLPSTPTRDRLIAGARAELAEAIKNAPAREYLHPDAVKLKQLRGQPASVGVAGRTRRKVEP